MRNENASANSDTFALPNLPDIMSGELVIRPIIFIENEFVDEPDSSKILFANPDADESDCLLASIVPFEGDLATKNWAFCDGSILQIDSNPVLFSLLGDIYRGVRHKREDKPSF